MRTQPQRRLPKPANHKSNIIRIRERRPGLVGRYRSADERRAEGAALRDAVPRELHGGWKAPSDRRDPVELLTESNKGRMPRSSRSVTGGWWRRRSRSIADRRH